MLGVRAGLVTPHDGWAAALSGQRDKGKTDSRRALVESPALLGAAKASLARLECDGIAEFLRGARGEFRIKSRLMKSARAASEPEC